MEIFVGNYVRVHPVPEGVVFLTFGIPYMLLSPLMQGITPAASFVLARAEFLDGFRIALIILAIINSAAIIPSLVRGKTASVEMKTESV